MTPCNQIEIDNCIVFLNTLYNFQTPCTQIEKDHCIVFLNTLYNFGTPCIQIEIDFCIVFLNTLYNCKCLFGYKIDINGVLSVFDNIINIVSYFNILYKQQEQFYVHMQRSSNNSKTINILLCGCCTRYLSNTRIWLK